MERLTEKHYLAEDHYMKCSGTCHVDMDCIDCPAFDKLVERLAAYEYTGLTPEEIKAPFTEDAVINLAAQALGVEAARLRELSKADKAGRCVVLPCKVGDTVWLTRTWFSDKLSNPEAETLTGAYICGDGRCTFVTNKYGFPQNEIGKTVFLTREEAERAMEGGKDG